MNFAEFLVLITLEKLKGSLMCPQMLQRVLLYPDQSRAAPGLACYIYILLAHKLKHYANPLTAFGPSQNRFLNGLSTILYPTQAHVASTPIEYQQELYIHHRT